MLFQKFKFNKRKHIFFFEINNFEIAKILKEKKLCIFLIVIIQRMCGFDIYYVCDIISSNTITKASE